MRALSPWNNAISVSFPVELKQSGDVRLEQVCNGLLLVDQGESLRRLAPKSLMQSISARDLGEEGISDKLSFDNL